MSKLRYSTSISLDGLTAGPTRVLSIRSASGGERCTLDKGREPECARPRRRRIGCRRSDHGSKHVRRRAGTMGSRALGRVVGADPPFHLPVFVLTHHPRPKLECEGGTTFTFITDGLRAALAQAMHAAGSQHVDICGGATVAKNTSPRGCSTRSSSASFRCSSAQASDLFDAKRLDKIDTRTGLCRRSARRHTYQIPCAPLDTATMDVETIARTRSPDEARLDELTPADCRQRCSPTTPAQPCS